MWIVVVSRHKRQQACVEAMQAVFGLEAFYPVATFTVKLPPRRGGSARKLATVVKPVFGNYVFVELQDAEMWGAIARNREVSHVVSVNGRPLFAGDAVVEGLRSTDWAGLAADKTECHSWAIGEAVELTSGPLVGLRGTIVGRGKIEVGLFGGKTVMSVAMSALKKV